MAARCKNKRLRLCCGAPEVELRREKLFLLRIPRSSHNGVALRAAGKENETSKSSASCAVVAVLVAVLEVVLGLNLVILRSSEGPTAVRGPELAGWRWRRLQIC